MNAEIDGNDGNGDNLVCRSCCSLDYVSILFSSLCMHIVTMTDVATALIGEFAKCSCLSGWINDLARAIWRWTEIVEAVAACRRSRRVVV